MGKRIPAFASAQALSQTSVTPVRGRAMKSSVHGEPAKPQPDSGRPSYVPVLKAVLVVSLAVLLAAVVMRLSGGKPGVVPPSEPAIAPELASAPDSSAP